MAISYEELYAQIYGSDYKSDLAKKVNEYLAEEDQVKLGRISTPKLLDQSMITAEFVESHRDKLLDYIIERIETIEVLMGLNLHKDTNNLVAEGALDLIYDSLKEIEVVHPYICYDLPQEALDIISKGQDLFIKRLYV